jgi:hypothetical protein
MVRWNSVSEDHLPVAKWVISGRSSSPKSFFRSTPPVEVAAAEDAAVEVANVVGGVPVASSELDDEDSSVVVVSKIEETAEDAADSTGCAVSPPAEVPSTLGDSSTLGAGDSAGLLLLLLLSLTLGAGLGADLPGAARALG